ncbi:hypothetical protein PG985_014440 [Apiospora marii]|uniref:uncharacterized protein n=1 Tax=Apiospora marii TaxID=335849 RepID=UPI0031314954
MIDNTVRNRDEILEALATYRHHVAARNRYALEQYVPLAEAAVAPEEEEAADDSDLEAVDEEGIAFERMEFLAHFTGHDLDRPLAGGLTLERPADLLTHYDAVAPQLGLDGTCRSPKTSEEARRQKRTEYVAEMEAYLKAHCLPSVRDDIAFPAELLVVAEQVDCLHGPGLAPEQEQKGIPFWSMEDGPPTLIEEPEQLANAACLDSVTDDLEVAGGWCCGHGYPGNAYVLLCREIGAGDEVPWRWKYTIEIAYTAQLFHSIPELLEAYKDTCAVDTAVYPEYGVEDVFGGVL